MYILIIYVCGGVRLLTDYSHLSKMDKPVKKTSVKKPTVKKPSAKKPDAKIEKSEINIVEPGSANAETVVPNQLITAQPRVKKISPLDSVIEKYTENGWEVIRCPKGSLNDIIATRNGRFQYVQVVATDDPKFHGEFKNNFVQNAFSNSATPVFAHVVSGIKGSVKITFEDANTSNRVIIGGMRKKE